jgi:hypothetical protein
MVEWNKTSADTFPTGRKGKYTALLADLEKLSPKEMLVIKEGNIASLRALIYKKGKNYSIREREGTIYIKKKTE